MTTQLCGVRWEFGPYLINLFHLHFNNLKIKNRTWTLVFDSLFNKSSLNQELRTYFSSLIKPKLARDMIHMNGASNSSLSGPVDHCKRTPKMVRFNMNLREKKLKQALFFFYRKESCEDTCLLSSSRIRCVLCSNVYVIPV